MILVGKKIHVKRDKIIESFSIFSSSQHHIFAFRACFLSTYQIKTFHQSNYRSCDQYTRSEIVPNFTMMCVKQVPWKISWFEIFLFWRISFSRSDYWLFESNIVCTFIDAEITLKMKEITGEVKIIKSFTIFSFY